jgi:hypothetical protein
MVLAGVVEGVFAALFDAAAKFSKRFGHDTIDKKASPMQQAKGYAILYAGAYGMAGITAGLLIGLVTLSLDTLISTVEHKCSDGSFPNLGAYAMTAFLTSELKSFATQPAYASILVANFPEFVLKGLNTSHRKNSIQEEASDLLKDFDPDAEFTADSKASRTCLDKIKQKLFGYDKVVQGGGVAYPAPVKAKFLALLLGMPALLFDSPMYAGWDMDERYSSSFLSALFSDYFSIFGQMYCCCCCCCCSKKKKKTKRPTFVKGADAFSELPFKRQVRVKALFTVLKKKSENLVQTFGDATVALAIENEIFLASGSDTGADEYVKRAKCVDFWLTDKDAGEQRCLQTRLGMIEPSAVVELVESLGLRKLTVLHLADVAGDESIATALEHEMFLASDSCEGAKYLKCIGKVQDWLEATGHMTFAGFTESAARKQLVEQRISKLRSNSVDPNAVVRKLAPAERSAAATKKASKSRRSNFYNLVELAVLALIYLFVVKPLFKSAFVCAGVDTKAECDTYPTKCVWDNTPGAFLPCEDCGTGQQKPCPKKPTGYP